VQQWYGDARFSGFSFHFDGTASASSSRPPSFESPLPANPQNDEEGEESEE
jgi:hypothetical protein